MKPPICCLCDKELEENEGGLVYFKKSPSDLEWDNKMKQPGMTGHPPYADWFCDVHLGKAKKLTNLTIQEALKLLKA
ncbi:MAG: hypothetical protein HWN65_05645 [Candidatus Helarchaeota archaeon]|nr:hypothetical protein [Candidatus Helarchaeota archaeon]